MSGLPSSEFVLYFVGFLLTWEAVSAVRSPRTTVIWRGLRLRHVLQAIRIILLVVASYYLIANLAPWTRWGWWSAVGGQGSVVLGHTDSVADPSLSWVHRLAPVVFLAALLCFLPSAARREERWFRLGSERRALLGRLLVAFAFGLLHLVMGIPIAAALALTAAGWGFQSIYLAAYARRGSRHDALKESTHVHLAYNLLLLSVVGVALALAVLR